MEQLRVRVTAQDIRRGVVCNTYFCPIARAIRRMGKARVSVDADVIRLRSREFYLPRSASLFIDRFDSGLPVKPFTFVAKQ